MLSLVATLLAAPPSPLIPEARASFHVTVCPSGCDFDTIQEAIDDAPSGGTVELSGDTFTENIEIDKSLTLVGAGMDTTVIQGVAEGGPTVSAFGEGPVVVIEDLTITGGDTEGSGGGIDSSFTSLTLRRVRVSGNNADIGAGVYSNYELWVENSVIEGNSAGSSGGAIQNDFGSVDIVDSEITGNDAGAGGGGAVLNDGGHVEITASSVHDNTSLGDGGAVLTIGGGECPCTLVVTDSMLLERWVETPRGYVWAPLLQRSLSAA